MTMTAGDRITAMVAQVKAAQEEFDMAVVLHEVWKPAAYDEQLHQRMGASYATHAFFAIRTALRREVLLALMRVWDRQRESVRLRVVIEALGESEFIDSLVTDRMGTLRKQSNMALNGFEEQIRTDIQEGASKAIALFAKWAPGGAGSDIRERLRIMRNQNLAHRQIEASVENKGASNEEIETFFQDTLALVKLLCHVIRADSYNPAQTAEVYSRPAALFWASVRGENTEGHPEYRPLT